jgi:hypothetical protein
MNGPDKDERSPDGRELNFRRFATPGDSEFEATHAAIRASADAAQDNLLNTIRQRRTLGPSEQDVRGPDESRRAAITNARQRMASSESDDVGRGSSESPDASNDRGLRRADRGHAGSDATPGPRRKRDSQSNPDVTGTGKSKSDAHRPLNRGLSPTDLPYEDLGDIPNVGAGIPLDTPPPTKRAYTKRATKALAPPPDTDKKAEYPVLGELYALTDAEASSMLEPLTKGFMKFWEISDGIISNTNKNKAPARIWQTIDETQTRELVTSLLGAGRANPLVAATARKLAETFNALQVGFILGPRFWQTFQFYLKNGGFQIGLF